MSAARPTIVCLCGSARFLAQFDAASLHETLAGRIVLSPGSHLQSDAQTFAGWAPEAVTAALARLAALHDRKIELADEVLVIDVGGYVGDSTAREVAYARALGKPVRYWEVGASGIGACPGEANV